MLIRILAACVCLMTLSPSLAQTNWSNQAEGNFIIRDFRFASGESLPELRLHYTTLGTAKRNSVGKIVNGVLLLHGTGGSGHNWLEPSLADELFGPKHPLDASQFFIIMPDGIGRGLSSKPSNALRTKFPHYRSQDVVTADYRLLTEGLGIGHLRLVLGSSSGGMHTWLWGVTHPDFMDGLVPLASQPSAMSGRNWLMRRIAIESIRNDPAWAAGNYQENPTYFSYSAPFTAMLLDSAINLQERAMTRTAADTLYWSFVEQARKMDANDLLYSIEMVMDYDPSKDLERIKARLLAINFADDEVNPPELDALAQATKIISHAQYVIIPGTKTTRGHSTHRLASVWKAHLEAFMKTLPTTP